MHRAQPCRRRLAADPPDRGAAAAPGRRTRATALLLATTLAVGVLGLPGESRATDATLRMAFGNILSGPFDSLTSPYTGGHILVNSLRDIDDSRGVRVTYALPGYLWLVGLQFGCGGIRTITGALESVPGVLLFPFDNDMGELFSPVESSSAIVLDWENPLSYNDAWWVRWNPVATPFSINLRWGLNYTRSDY